MKNTENAMNKIKNNIILQILLFAVLMLILFLVYTFALHSIEDDVHIRKELNAPDTALSFVSNIELVGEHVELNGSVVYPDAEIVSVDVIFTSLSEKSDSVVVEAVLAEDKSASKCVEYLGLEDRVINGAFSLKMKEGRLEEDSCYRVDLHVTYVESDNGKILNEKKYKDTTGQYLYGGKLYSYNPLTFSSPSFIDERMQQVVREGKLCSYNKTNGAWIYLYDGYVYWILDGSLARNANENLYMYFHLFTTRIELLPEYRQPYRFDNRDFYFKNYELSLEGNSIYRVARMDISVEYPIAYINTGEFNFEKNIWSVRVELPFVR